LLNLKERDHLKILKFTKKNIFLLVQILVHFSILTPICRASVSRDKTVSPHLLDKSIFKSFGFEMVPQRSLHIALDYWEKNKAKLKNKTYLSIINYAQNSAQRRFYILNMKLKKVWAFHTAHGKGSDPLHSGQAMNFSNDQGTNASSLGFFVTGETYIGTHGISLRLDGLSESNSEARSRGLVIHGADYVSESDTIQGRSFGCPALAMGIHKEVINMLKDGSLIFAAYEPSEKPNRSLPYTADNF
jgi:hypothetical protein